MPSEQQEEGFTEKIGLRPWVFLVAFCIIFCSLLCISIPWLVITYNNDLENEEDLVRLEIQSGLERLHLGIQRAQAIALGLAGYVRSQMHYHPTPKFSNRTTNYSQPDLRLRESGFNAYCSSQSQRFANVVKYFTVRPLGVVSNIFPSHYTAATTGEEEYNNEPFTTRYNWAIARNHPVFILQTAKDDNKTVLYSATVAVFNTSDIPTQSAWLPTDGLPHTIAQDKWWGAINVVINTTAFVRNFVSLFDTFDGLDLEVVVRFSDTYDPQRPASRIVETNTDGEAMIAQDDYIEETLHPTDDQQTRIGIAARPRKGWKTRAPETSIIGLVVGSLCVAAVVVIVWIIIAAIVRHRADRYENRMHLAPKTLPVNLCMIEVVGVTAVWLADPIAMTRVTTRFRDLARSLSFEYEGYECRTIGDGMLIAARSPQKLLQFTEKICLAMKQEPWNQSELQHFPGNVIRVQATLHLCTRARIRHSEGKACDYTGDDVRDLLQVHVETPTRQRPIILTDAAAKRLKADERKNLVPADDMTKIVSEFVTERSANTQFSEAEVKSQKLYPLNYLTTVESPPMMAYITVPDDDTATTSTKRTGANNLSAEGAARASTSTDTHTTTPGAVQTYICPAAIADRLSELISQMVSSPSARASMLHVAAYFYEAYSIAFSPFEEKQLERIFRAVQEVFSLSPTPGEVLERKELQIRLAVRCARIFLHALKHRGGGEEILK